MRGVDHYLHDWEYFVAELARGYGFCVYDYLNDLDSRVVLRRALRQSITGQSKATEARLKEIDARFVEVTDPVKPLIAAGNAELIAMHFDPEDQWLARVPKELVGELREDMLEG